MNAVKVLIVKLIINNANSDDNDGDGGDDDYEETLRNESTFPRDWFDRLAHPIHEGRKPITWR